MRGTPAVVALALALTALLAPVAVAAPGALPVDAGGAQDGDGGVAPGEHVAGVVGAEQGELDGEVEERAFGVQVRRAGSDEARAEVVGDRLNRVEARLDEIEQRLQTLEERRQRGEITRGEHAASVARLEAERRSLERQLERSAATADDLPGDVRADRGADRERVDALRQRASELGGQEVREIARSIAGPGVGGGVGPPDHAGGGNASERGPPDHAAVNRASDDDGADASEDDAASADGSDADGPADPDSDA